MTPAEFVKAVYSTVDRQEPEAFASYLTDTCIFVYGNHPPVRGRPQVAAYVKQFFSMIRSLSHEVVDVWEVADAIITRAAVTYTRHDSINVTFPCVTIWLTVGAKISDYRIYIDNSSLFGDSHA